MSLGDTTIYDVRYTVDDHGLRHTPNSTEAADALVFFGGSITFGEGVADDQTVAYFAAQEAGYDLQILNFGVPGYGPHQMLRAIKVGWPERLIKGRVRGAFFQTGSFHIGRAAGHSYWDQFGPQYEIDDAGRIVYHGPFSTRLFYYANKVLFRSKAYAFFFNRLHRLGRRDVRRYAAIVAEASRRFEAAFGVAIVVLYWDDEWLRDEGHDDDGIIELLREGGVPVVRVSEIVGHPFDRYRIEGDGHPTAAAHERIGTFLARTFIAPR